MKKASLAMAIALVTLPIAAPSMLQAQKSASPAPSASALAAPDLSKLGLASASQQAAATATASPNGEAPAPLQVVVQFLQLTPGQQQVFGELLQARQSVIPPILAQIQQLQQQLAALLSSGANPAAIGATVIQINALQQQVAQHQQDFLSKFVSILDSDQQQRFQAIQIAAQLQPVLPAFAQLALI